MLVDRFGRRRCEWVARPGCSVVRCVQFGGGGVSRLFPPSAGGDVACEVSAF